MNGDDMILYSDFYIVTDIYCILFT